MLLKNPDSNFGKWNGSDGEDVTAAAFLHENHGAQIRAVPFASGVHANARRKSRGRGVYFSERQKLPDDAVVFEGAAGILSALHVGVQHVFSDNEKKLRAVPRRSVG